MKDAKIYENKQRPVFVAGDETTTSFLGAIKMLADGKSVDVTYNGVNVGKLQIGKIIDGFDSVYELDDSEPYGTIHWAIDEHSWYIHLPDELCEE